MSNLKWLVLMPSFAFAGGGFDQNSNQEVNQSVKTGVDVEVGGSQFSSESVVEGSNTRAYAFSHGLGDVDIADCLASTQFGTILFSTQNVKLNKWCAGEIYDAKGLHEMAARMRCEIKEVAKLFTTNRECIAANTVSNPPSLPVMAPLPEEEACNDDCEDQLEQVSELEERVATLEKKREQDIRRPRPKTEIIQQGITDEQRAALERVFNK